MIEENRATKVCLKCGQELPLVSFSRDKSRKDGLHPYCKGCWKAYRSANLEKLRKHEREYGASRKEERRIKNRVYYQRNSEHLIANQRAYYAETRNVRQETARQYYRDHREECKAYKREHWPLFYANHRDKSLAWSRQWYQRNKERRRHQNKMWARAHPEAVKAIIERRRATLQNAEINDLTYKEWETILREYGYRCAYCFLSGPLSMDHIIPLSKGGDHTADNVVPACRSCNSSKGDKSLWAWELYKRTQIEMEVSLVGA